MQAATAHHLDLACVKLHDTQVQLNKTEDQSRNTQNQLNNTQETTKELVEKVDALQRQLKEKLDEKQVMQINKGKCFMWKIDNFSEFLRQAKTGQRHKIESVPLYTESCGYKLKIVFYPNGNGDGSNTHLSVFSYAIKGEYDAILQWPLQIAVRFTLIDQQCDALHRENVQLCFTQTINRPNENSDHDNSRGFIKFISHEKLETRRYLVDDALFLQVEIGPTVNELKSWSTSSLYTCEPTKPAGLPVSVPIASCAARRPLQSTQPECVPQIYRPNFTPAKSAKPFQNVKYGKKM